MTFREVTQTLPGGKLVTMQADMRVKAVRIHHPTLRNCIFTIEMPDIIYKVPDDCGLCGKQHIFKTYHFNLNANGDVTVAPELYERFKEVGLIKEMKAMKEVTPRPSAIGMSTIDQSGGIIPTSAPPLPRNDVISREHGKNGG